MCGDRLLPWPDGTRQPSRSSQSFPRKPFSLSAPDHVDRTLTDSPSYGASRRMRLRKNQMGGAALAWRRTRAPSRDTATAFWPNFELMWPKLTARAMRMPAAEMTLTTVRTATCVVVDVGDEVRGVQRGSGQQQPAGHPQHRGHHRPRPDPGTVCAVARGPTLVVRERAPSVRGNEAGAVSSGPASLTTPAPCSPPRRPSGIRRGVR